MSTTSTSAASALPHLILHFDVNETILMGDPAGGDTYMDCIHKSLAKCAFCKADGPLGKNGATATTPTVWHDGTPIGELPSAPPPLKPEWTFDTPAGVAAFYKQPALKRKHLKTFCDAGSPGAIYAAERARCRAALGWPHAPHPALSMEEDGGAVGVLLPAFYQTLDGLRRSGRRFSIVLRTFGTDLPRVAAAINAYAAGEHPDYPEGAPDLALPPQRMWKGRYDEGSGRFALSPHDEGNGAPSITDEREAVAALSEHGVSGVMDDYKYWASHDNDPACGKPLWLTLGDASTYQLFFDDNIQCAAAARPDAHVCRSERLPALRVRRSNDAKDSIVSVRARRDDTSPAFAPLSGAQICALHGAAVRRVPTILPVLDTGWFLAEVERCEARLAELRGSPLWAELCAASGGDAETDEPPAKRQAK